MKREITGGDKAHRGLIGKDELRDIVGGGKMQVKIGPYVYSVKSVNNLHSEEGKTLYGYVLHGEQEIQICTGFPKEKRSVTLLHEMLHAIDYVYGIDLSESQVCTLAAVLFDVLETNGFLKEMLPDG